MPVKSGSRNLTHLLIAVALLAGTMAVYIQVRGHQFLNLDDPEYVTSNRHITSGLSVGNTIWAFTSLESYNWHPLTWLSHMLDVQLFGLNPAGHHLTSVAMHAFSTILLFALLKRTTGNLWPSAYTATLFALHPLHVESVAWVAERKDVLSTVFAFLTLLCYAAHCNRPRLWTYLLTLGCFVMGLMSKPMLVSLPFLMLLMDYWPLQRFKKGENYLVVLREKLPFLGCALLSGVVTIVAQQKGGALTGLSLIPFWLRFENALVAYATYIFKMIWPTRLAVYYPFPPEIPLWQVSGALLVLLLFSAAALRLRHRHPYLLVGWLWYLITLVPVIGLIQVGGQSMADRYTYIPLIGLFIMAAWGLAALAEKGPAARTTIGVCAAVAATGYGACTWHQLGYWRDSVTLYRHTLAITKDNSLIHNNLGYALQMQGDTQGAIWHYLEALRISPAFPLAHINMGTVAQSLGHLDDAIRHYQQAIAASPGDVIARYNLGTAYQAAHQWDQAIREYRAALRSRPDLSDIHLGLGNCLAMKNEFAEAAAEFGEVLRLKPDEADAKSKLELVLGQLKAQAR